MFPCETGPRSAGRCEAGREGTAGLDGVVEGKASPGDLLVRLVALPRDDNQVAGTGGVERQADGNASIRLDHDPGVADPAGDAHQHLLDDGRRILVARVVGRHEGEVAEVRCGCSHQGPLGPVTVPTAAEDAEHTPGGRQCARLSEHHLQPDRCVGVVDQHREWGALIGSPAGWRRSGHRRPRRGDDLQPARYGCDVGQGPARSPLARGPTRQGRALPQPPAGRCRR